MEKYKFTDIGPYFLEKFTNLKEILDSGNRFEATIIALCYIDALSNLFMKGIGTKERFLNLIFSYGIVNNFRQDKVNLAEFKKVEGKYKLESKICSGILRDNNVYLPKAFVDYVYKYYYDNRPEIFTCLFLHEISHSETGLADKPVETHFLVDWQAFEFLLSTNFPNDISYKINEFYSFLRVIQNFIESEKGVGKQCFNIAWNTLNTATLLYAGVGSFIDWFAYDISTRVSYFYNRNIQNKPKFIFKRSSFQRTIK